MLDTPDLQHWEKIDVKDRTVDHFKDHVKIAIVGKYNGLSDSYLSVLKSLMHSSIHLNVEVVVEWVDAALLQEDAKATRPESHAEEWRKLHAVAGVVIPGGFGDRGVEGKILAAHYCRTRKIPMLGVCLGMQVTIPF